MTFTHSIGPVAPLGSVNPESLHDAAQSVPLMSSDFANPDFEDDMPDLPQPLVLPASRKGGLRRTLERGQATAEYVVGILAAVAMALVLLKIFTGNQFFNEMLKFVVGLITKAGAMLP